MPRKRKDILITKQNRLIATRLMQINLLVDDYLYLQKNISQRSAEVYITEITGYKEKCCQDARSLQVIEKLTRCMKGIILEQQELDGAGQTEEALIFPSQDNLNTDTTMLSPVYSTADEDSTQIAFVEIDNISQQIHDIETTPGKKENNHGLQAKGEVTTDKVSHNNPNETESYKNNFTTQKTVEKDPLNNDIEVLDLCVSEIDESDAFRLQGREFNIQKAISNLSIKDIEEAFTPFSQQCSQSILETYYPIHTYNTSYTQNSKPKDIAVPLMSNLSIAKDTLPNIVLPIKQKKLPAANKTVPILNMTAQIAVDISKEANTVKPNTKKRCVKNKKPSEAIETNTVKTKKSRAKIIVKKDAKKAKNVKAGAKELKQEKTMQELYKTITNQNLQSIGNTKSPLTQTQLSTEHTVMKTHDKYNKKIPIYNNAVVNDLSWIENIRFVREIPSEEYEHITLNEDFWENCNLPDCWNENDFD